MDYPRVKRRTDQAQDQQGIYASLDELIRLQYLATDFSFLPRQPVHSILYGAHASRMRGRGLDFDELRGYQPGDDPRNIDWKITARTRSPFVRVYTEERDRPVMLLVDQRISMFFGSRGSMKSVTASRIAALAAWRVLDAGDRVGAVVYNDADLAVIPPHRSRRRVMQLLGQVVKMNHGLHAGQKTPANPQMLNEALKRARQYLHHDGLLVTIGDGFGLDDESRRLVTDISRHNDALAAFVFDPLERELPAAGRLVFSDGSGQLEVNTAQSELRDLYAADFLRRREEIETLARRYRIPIIEVDASQPELPQIQGALGFKVRSER